MNRTRQPNGHFRGEVEKASYGKEPELGKQTEEEKQTIQHPSAEEREVPLTKERTLSKAG